MLLDLVKTFRALVLNTVFEMEADYTCTSAY